MIHTEKIKTVCPETEQCRSCFCNKENDYGLVYGVCSIYTVSKPQAILWGDEKCQYHSEVVR